MDDGLEGRYSRELTIADTGIAGCDRWIAYRSRTGKTMTESDSNAVNRFRLDYSLSAEGEATVRLSNGAKTVESRVSDLHDNLLDLARLALSLQAGEFSARAVFVVDPGELHLAVEIDQGAASYEVRRYEDWASLQPGKDWPYEVLLDGVTTPAALIGQVTESLARLRDDPGPERYRALWRQHAFPAEEFRKLEARDDLASGREINTPMLLTRALLVAAIAPPVYAIVHWLCTLVFSLYGLVWVPHIISLLVAAEVGWVIWSRSRALQTLAGSDRATMLGALTLGAAGFAAGFYGPLIFLPNSLQAPVLGALGVGAAGFLLGGIAGRVVWRVKIRY